MTSGSETSAKTRGMATAFSVGKVFSTITTVADEREYSTLRSPGQDVVWRVRARRQLYGSTNNGLPRVSYGPWSDPIYSEPAGAADASAQLHTVSSDATSWGKAAREHKTMPVFVWPNDGFEFHRVYVSTDDDCVNIVHVGSIVGGTAYAPEPRVLSPSPRRSGTTRTFTPSSSTEPRAKTHCARTERSQGQARARRRRTRPPPPRRPRTKGRLPVDLWDSNWHSGRYYWTVVPVTRHLKRRPGGRGERTG